MTAADLAVVTPVEAGADDGRGERAPQAARRDGMGYVWDVAEFGVSLRVDYLTLRAGEVLGEVEVLTASGRHLHQARHSLSSTTSRLALVRALEGRARSVPWDRLIEGFCAAVIRKEREGQPMVYVGQAPVQRTRYVVDELVIEGKPNLLYGPGASGKGYLCVRLAVGMLAGRGLGRLTTQRATPLYLDWEDDAETMNARVQRVCRGLEIEPVALAYKRMRGLLPDRVNEIAREVARARATVGFVDSVSACSGSPGRGETWDYVAHRTFDALDLIPSGVPGVPMTWVLVGHVTGEAASRRGDVAGRIFGSIQMMNRARNGWELRSDQAPGSETVRAVLYHGKWNHTGYRRPIGLTFTFGEDRIVIDEATAARLPSARPTLADRLADHLAEHGRASVRALSLGLREPENKLRAVLARERERFVQEGGFWSLREAEMEAADPTPEGLPW